MCRMLIFKHTFDFAAHGVPAGLVEMNLRYVGSLDNLLQSGGNVSDEDKRPRGVNSLRPLALLWLQARFERFWFRCIL